jgi:hypothetical protein
MHTNRFIFLFLFAVVTGYSQSTNTVYTTTSGELIFSWAGINQNGSETGSVMRFSPVVNIQNWVNFDKTEHFGLFTGLSVRNVGFIYDDPRQANVRFKARTYNLGIPIGVKTGNLSDRFLFFGYELEVPFTYKEKRFVDENKVSKSNVWFSDKITAFNHSLMAGVQLTDGATLKFKYYLTNFFNKGYVPTNQESIPYHQMDVNIFYFSLNFGLLKNIDFYYNDK